MFKIREEGVGSPNRSHGDLRLRVSTRVVPSLTGVSTSSLRSDEPLLITVYHYVPWLKLRGEVIEV